MVLQTPNNTTTALYYGDDKMAQQPQKITIMTKAKRQ
jgi:hypothetical protein